MLNITLDVLLRTLTLLQGVALSASGLEKVGTLLVVTCDGFISHAFRLDGAMSTLIGRSLQSVVIFPGRKAVKSISRIDKTNRATMAVEQNERR